MVDHLALIKANAELANAMVEQLDEITRLRAALAEYVCTCEDECAVDTFRRHDGICGRPARAALEDRT